MRVAVATWFVLALFVAPAAAQQTGTITGVVLSSAGSSAVPDAIVTLYDMDGYFVNAPDNPQQSSNGTGNNVGVYTFYDLPAGIYNVTAEKGGVLFFAIADLSRGGTASANVVLPEFVEPPPEYAPPPVYAPTPKPFYHFLPVWLGRAPATRQPDEGLPFGLAVAGGIGALLLFAGRRGG